MPLRKINIRDRIGNFAELVNKWKVVCAQADTIDEYADKDGADWESLCVGWCIANGLSIEQAYDFYQAMIPLQLF